MSDGLQVLLVGNYADDAQHSMLGFGRALYRGLPQHNVEATFIAPTRKLWRPRGRLDKWGAYVDKYVLFPKHLRDAARRADVVHVLDQGNGIYLGHLRSRPNLVTCHDLLAIRSALGELPYWHAGGTGRIYQAAIRRGLKAARFAACVSSATRKDFDRLVGLPESQVRIIHMGLLENWREQRGVAPTDACRAAGLTPDTKFALQMGGSTIYKNCPAAVNIFAELQKLGPSAPTKLVIVGKHISPELNAQITDLGLSDKTLRLSGLAGTDLEWLYSNAWGLLLTSFDEGFGLPIIEGQSCGCPVFATDKEPMTEVGGDGALYIDPADPVASANRIMGACPPFNELKQRGHQNVKSFTTEAMVSAYVELYKELLVNSTS